MRYPSRTPLLSPLLLVLLAAAASAVPIPSSLDLLSHPASANGNQAPLRGASAKAPLSFPVRPNPKGWIDYTRDMLDPILCPMAATGGGDSKKRPAASGAARRSGKAKGRGAGGDAGGLCAAWCARVKGEAADGAAAKAGSCDDSG
ncbi:hypothetical protein IWX90DRAFT_18464 [Phyllosticta citrichinensis]|uniref:Uncharacterized protein n=1 Tax=Phyllosticta citrichinensis TaxID=1130410 RepID=A0ABR1Y722_9PEZI